MTSDGHIKTSRLTLRPPSWRDALFYVILHRNPQVRQYLGGAVRWRDLPVRLLHDICSPRLTGIWVVTLGHKRIGMITLSPHKDGQDHEISYQFHPKEWGNGYAIEATDAVLQSALSNTALPRIIAETQAANTASRRLLERLMMIEIARLNRFNAEQVIYAKTGA